MSEAQTYKNVVIAGLILLVVLMFAKGCNDNEELQKTNDAYNGLLLEYETAKYYLEDSIDGLYSDLENEKLRHDKEIEKYKSMKPKERIKLITKIDSFAIPTDTGAILSLHGVDSVNKLAMHYQSCVVQSAIKDTIITHLTSVVQVDSVIIETQKKQAKAQKKAAKIKLIKAAVFSGLVGIIVGLVI